MIKIENYNEVKNFINNEIKKYNLILDGEEVSSGPSN